MSVRLISYPQFRHEIKGSFRDLANRELQMKEWVRIGAAHRYWDSLKLYALDTLYNMHDLDERACQYVGEIFYNKEEAQTIHRFCEWFDVLTDDIGGNASDSAYLEHPEWPKVWEGAKKIFEIMEANDKKYNIRASWEAWNESR